MERITIPGYRYHDDEFMDSGVAKFFNRLSAYEDSGLEPEDMAHWMDYFRAECEGRLVVLPCKVGDTVWVIWGKDVIYYIVDRIHILANNQVQIRAKHHVIDNVYLYPDMFGKTVFLTREEAEAVLAQKGDSEQ